MMSKYQKMLGLSDDVVQEIKEFAVGMFDELSGAKTTDLATMENAVIVAFKP